MKHKELDKVIRAFYKANDLAYKFKREYGIELSGDGVTFYTWDKDELYKLSDLLKIEVTVDGDPNLIAIHTLQYDHKVRFCFIEKKPISKEMQSELIDKLKKEMDNIAECNYEHSI